MKKKQDRFFSLMMLCLGLAPLLGGCTQDTGLQTHIWVPRVTLDDTGKCYQTKGIRLVRWPNLIKSHRDQKAVIKEYGFNKVQKEEWIYTHIPSEFLEDKDPIWDLAAGSQNLFSIPITALIAWTKLPGLKKERTACQKRHAKDEDPLFSNLISIKAAEEAVKDSNLPEQEKPIPKK